MIAVSSAAVDKRLSAEFSVISPEGVEQVLNLQDWPVLMGKARDCPVALSGMSS